MKDFNIASIKLGRAITDFLEAFREEASKYSLKYSEENIGDIAVEVGGLATTEKKKIEELKTQLAGDGYYFIWTNTEDLCFSFLTGVPWSNATDEEIEKWLNSEYFNLTSLVKDVLPYRAFAINFTKLLKLEDVQDRAIKIGKFTEEEIKAIKEGEVLLPIYALAKEIRNNTPKERAIPETHLALIIAKMYEDAFAKKEVVRYTYD